jgi:hypothetical protein
MNFWEYVYILEQKISTTMINCVYFIMNFLSFFSRILYPIFSYIFVFGWRALATTIKDMYFSSA